MDGFRRVVDYCAFQDLGYCGSDFTWCNMQDGENRIYLRLDRALANLEWIDKFGGMKPIIWLTQHSTTAHCLSSIQQFSAETVLSTFISKQCGLRMLNVKISLKIHVEWIWTSVLQRVLCLILVAVLGG